MDDQIQQNDEQRDATEIPLGSGINIVRSEEIPEDDVEFEMYNEDVPNGLALTPQERIKILREKLRDCTNEKQEYLDGWQRLKADFVNFKKRTEEEKTDFLKFSREGIIADLLPVLEDRKSVV